jgi:anti-anti-sigma regulatory factor
MEITVTQTTATLAILHLDGKLDGLTYESLLTEAQKLYNAGVRDLVLDLSKVTFMSSAGISALHRVALIYRGEKPENLEEGWASYHAIHRESGGVQQHVKLLSPTEKVAQILEVVGFTTLFEVHTSPEQAIASFN